MVKRAWTPIIRSTPWRLRLDEVGLLKVARPGTALSVSRGEVFGVAREDHSTSGYRTRVEAAAGVTHLGTEREQSEGFGGSARMIERFRCDRPGRFRIYLIEARAWEDGADRTCVTVECV